jgi:hypothetical protein
MMEINLTIYSVGDKEHYLCNKKKVTKIVTLTKAEKSVWKRFLDRF